MKQFILFAITLIYSTALLAQTRPALFGKVVNAEGENIEYANVIGPTVLTQGREEAYCYFDIALRQLLFKKRVSLSLVAHDILRTAKYTNFRI